MDAYVNNGNSTDRYAPNTQILTAGKALTATPTGKPPENNQYPDNVDNNPLDIKEYQPPTRAEIDNGILNVTADHDKEEANGNPIRLDKKLELETADDKAVAPDKDANEKRELGSEQPLSKLERLRLEVKLHPKLVNNCVTRVGNTNEVDGIKKDNNELPIDDEPKILEDIANGRVLDSIAIVEGTDSSKPVMLDTALLESSNRVELLDNVDKLADSESKGGTLDINEDKVREPDNRPIKLVIPINEVFTNEATNPESVAKEKRTVK